MSKTFYWKNKIYSQKICSKLNRKWSIWTKNVAEFRLTKFILYKTLLIFTPFVTLCDLAWPCAAYCDLSWPFMASYLTVTDQNSFGLVQYKNSYHRMAFVLSRSSCSSENFSFFSLKIFKYRLAVRHQILLNCNLEISSDWHILTSH